MPDVRETIEKLADTLKGKLSEVLGALAPEPDAIPIPVRNDPRRDPRRH